MRFKLEKTELIDMFHFKLFEGTFLDTEETNTEIRVYANLTDLHSPMEESSLYVYAHPYSSLYDASAYFLNSIGDEWEMKEQLKEAWRKELTQ